MNSIRLLSVVYTVTAFLLTAMSVKVLLPRLSKSAGQPIYREGPSWHIKKQGTPTLGGLGFLFAFSVLFAISAFFLCKSGKTREMTELILLFSYAVLHGLLGLSDDLTKLKHRENAGLTPPQKLFFQFLFAALYLLARSVWLHDGTSVFIGKTEMPLGFFYYPAMIFLMLGIVNCANLTDGIDGLASSVAFAIGIGVLYISYLHSLPVFLIASVLIGAAAGFLLFNSHPAKIFMGDTGSLFLGAIVVGCAFSLRSPLLLLPLCIVYVAEGVSVVLQVFFYKCTKKRVFLMAPLHHHLEKKGWSENRICLCALFLTLLFSVPAFFLFCAYGS